MSRSQTNEVGGKAANLGELLNAGFPVPDGQVLTTEAFDRFARFNHLGTRPTSESIRSSPIPQDVKDALSAIAGSYGDVLLAVRSSGTAEDLSRASFAGQYETVLGVKGAAEMEDAVKRCWASAFSSQVLAYKDARNPESPSDSAGMAVLIQRLVRADAAGVAFTANPVTGDRDEVLVNSIRGVGDRLVSGTATPDEWVVRESEVLCTSSPENSISSGQARVVADLAKQVAGYFGSPQDIEWAMSGGQLFLLQARPITTSKPERPVPDIPPVPIPIVAPYGYWTLDREHFPQPISPLFASYSLEIMSDWIRALAKDIGLPFDRMDFKVIGGWEYGRVVPPGGKDRKPPPAWFLRLLVRIVPSVRAKVKKMNEAVRTDVTGRYVQRWRDEWKPELIQRSTDLLAVDLTGLSDEQLDAHLSSVLEYARRSKEIHLRYVSITMLDVAEFGVLCEDHMKWDALDVFDLLSGFSEKDREPSRRLAELVERVRANPTLSAAVREDLRSSRFGHAISVDPAFADEFSRYMRDFGVAVLGYDIIDPTLAEMPLELLRLIDRHTRLGYDPSANDSKLQKRSAAGEAEIERANLPGDVKARMKTSLARARIAYGLHDEETFYGQHLADGITRYACLELGARLAARGIIRKRDDVFMLTWNEGREALRRGGNQKPLVEKRLGERAWAIAHRGPASYGTAPPPPPPMDVFPKEVQGMLRSLMWTFQGIGVLGKAEGDSGRLQGTPASSGSYEGCARIVQDETEFGKLQPGDVLVCPSTAPSWSVVFSLIGGLVTEAGGVLSHPAIVAREYGIPAVLSVEGATQKLKDGQRVRVDGDKGIVTPVA